MRRPARAKNRFLRSSSKPGRLTFVSPQTRYTICRTSCSPAKFEFSFFRFELESIQQSALYEQYLKFAEEAVEVVNGFLKPL